MISLCIIGYGRMGKTIESLASSYDCKVDYIINRQEDWDDNKIKKCDVAIDFSLPNSAFSNISRCIKLGVPIVSGTTGWLEKLSEIQDLLASHPESSFLYGSNFSLGMQMFFILNKQLSALMQPLNYKVKMEEIHHTQKLDAPSGTAITLAEDILGSDPKLTKWVNEPSDSPDTLGIISIRTPDVPGTHIVSYENEIDTIEIKHTAKSRKGFAIGAIQCARWLKTKNKKGYYLVSDYVADLL